MWYLILENCPFNIFVDASEISHSFCLIYVGNSTHMLCCLYIKNLLLQGIHTIFNYIKDLQLTLQAMRLQPHAKPKKLP
jgi:hypothetical protein